MSHFSRSSIFISCPSSLLVRLDGALSRHGSDYAQFRFEVHAVHHCVNLDLCRSGLAKAPDRVVPRIVNS